MKAAIVCQIDGATMSLRVNSADAINVARLPDGGLRVESGFGAATFDMQKLGEGERMVRDIAGEDLHDVEQNDAANIELDTIVNALLYALRRPNP